MYTIFPSSKREERGICGQSRVSRSMKNVSMTTLISGRRIYCISWHEKRDFHVYMSEEANNLYRNSSPITGLSSAPAALRGGRQPSFKQAHTSSPFFFLDVVLSRSVAHLLSRVDGASDGPTVSRIRRFVHADCRGEGKRGRCCGWGRRSRRPFVLLTH